MPLELSLGQVFLSEFMGTAMLLLLGAGVCAATSFNHSNAKGAGWLTINWGWGIAVFAGALVAFKTGGHLNPAVTLGTVASGADYYVGSEGAENAVPVTAATTIIYIVAQFLGAFVGAALCWLAYKKQFDADQPAGSKLGAFSTGPQIKAPVWNVVTEAIATFVLVFVIFCVGRGTSEAATGTPVSNLGWLGALGVAVLIVGIGASLGGPTGYAINPARDLGPRLWFAVMPSPNKGSANWGYAWVPVVGPIIGGVVAGLLVNFVPFFTV
ncbi:MAG: aquaporin family protein [Propionibacteriaceae bacterium]|jgi:glycerol uptake facilitator protein|nr:aquaporin family protein [Propionibacteriaceae bacterium]